VSHPLTLFCSSFIAILLIFHKHSTISLLLWFLNSLFPASHLLPHFHSSYVATLPLLFQCLLSLASLLFDFHCFIPIASLPSSFTVFRLSYFPLSLLWLSFIHFSFLSTVLFLFHLSLKTDAFLLAWSPPYSFSLTGFSLLVRWLSPDMPGETEQKLYQL
jgi:ABC-type glucose/galactose transport system permease subunit